jgi:hypothetical protein
MEKEYKLNIDPSILELLGPNLYTNIYYVLAELIANAYDADAKNVYIIDGDNEIRVEDDGWGMSYVSNEITKYLNVASVSRTTKDESKTKSGKRYRMGRKGIGKLAALSVSEDVAVLTIAKGETDKSGFILSRHPGADKALHPIPESEIKFNYVKDQGSAIVMRKPRYHLARDLKAVAKNLLKIFPMVSKDFRIHLIRGSKSEVIDDFEKEMIQKLSCLITLGDDFKSLDKLFKTDFPSKREQLVKIKESEVETIDMANREGMHKTYQLEIHGWIGTYRSSSGQKKLLTDFPDNFISIFANGKLGEFNILPTVGKNKLNEVYVVGQLHIDLFELTELPDMALSNRQGYKSDDPRYKAMLDFVREKLLPEIMNMRKKYTDLKKKDKEKKKEEANEQSERKLKADYDRFRKKTGESIARRVSRLIPGSGSDSITKIVSQSMNENSLDLGLKAVVDSNKKKILISHASEDETFADVVYQMLLFNGASPEDILYTSCDDEVSRIPEGEEVYEYLRKFFVESYSTQKIFVLFVTSSNIEEAWGCMIEIGAAWITKMDYKIFNIAPFRPQRPLEDGMLWQETNREPGTNGSNDVFWTNAKNADIFCSKIEFVCEALGYSKKERGENTQHLGGLIDIRG